MSRVFDPVLQHLRELVLRMGSRSEAILDKSLRAIWQRDQHLVAEIPEDDLEIDRLDVEIDDGVLKTLATQAPVAEDLREVIAIKMIATDLERVGDLARNISKSAARLSHQPEILLAANLRGLARHAQRVLRVALDAYGHVDAQTARGVLEGDSAINAEEDEIVRAALRDIPLHPDHASDAVDLILVAKNLERVADHATNIAESVILVAEARNVKHAMKLAR